MPHLSSAPCGKQAEERARKQLLSFVNILLGGIFLPGFLPASLKVTVPQCCLQEAQRVCKQSPLCRCWCSALPAPSKLILASCIIMICPVPRLAWCGTRAEGVGGVGGAQIEIHPWPLHAWLPLRNVPELSKTAQVQEITPEPALTFSPSLSSNHEGGWGSPSWQGL